MLDIYHPIAKVILFVGNFGSGKTEIAINYSVQLRKYHENIAIVDLDVIKPYFRCRSATEWMQQNGIRVIIPSGEHRYADLPIVVPEIKGMIMEYPGIMLLDVGGEDTGARVLSYLGEAFQAMPAYEFLLVVNRNRPFTSDRKGVLRVLQAIEKTAGLKITGLISNNHMMQDTNIDMVCEGYEFTKEISHDIARPIYFVSVPEHLQIECQNKITCPILPLHRHLLPPHMVRGTWHGI